MTTTISNVNGRAAIIGDRRCKPPVHPINVEAIPDAIKLLDRTLGWRWTLNEKANGGKGKWDKPPINARTGGPGSSTNAATWCRFDEAVAAQRAGRIDGIGFALGECDGGLYIAGIDLDDCRDPNTGEIEEWALAIVRLIGSYAEVSPSGTGIKIIFIGKLPSGTRKNGNIECYDSGRYFTVTGRVLDDGPRKLRDATVEVEQFFQAYMTPAPANTSGLSDAELAAAAVRAMSAWRADDYWQWIQVGMAAKAAGVSLSDWEQWSATSGKYVDGECARKWASFNRGGVGLGSLIYWAKQDGWTPPERATADNSKEWNDWRVEIIHSQPRVYKLYSPRWKGGVELSVRQFRTWSQVAVQIQEQQDVNLPNSFCKQKRWAERISIRLVNEAKPLPATIEDSRDLITASALHGQIAAARTMEKEDVDATTPRRPFVVDGGHCFRFDEVFEWLSRGADRVTRKELSDVLTRIGATYQQFGKEDGRVRYKCLDKAAFDKLKQMAGVDD